MFTRNIFTTLFFPSIFLFAVAVPSVTYAINEPRLYLHTAQSQYPPDSDFVLQILIDSVKAVNAYDIQIVYPASLELISYNQNDSIIDVWHRVPSITDGNILTIQGGSIKPFTGMGGRILAAHFKAKEAGDMKWTFTRANIYLANGFGTLSTADITGTHVIISKDAPVIDASLPDDIKAPVIQRLAVIPDPFTGSMLLSWNVADHESGVARTEMRALIGFVWTNWKVVKNPALIPPNALALEMRASDYSGNEIRKTIMVWKEIGRVVLIWFVSLIIFWGIYRGYKKYFYAK